MNKIQSILDAERLIKKGNVAAATEQYVEFIRQNPFDVTAINALGDLYVRTGKVEEAVKEFLAVADIYDRKNAVSLAMAMLKKVLKWSPYHEEATQKLAESFARQTKPLEACELLLEAARFYEKIGRRQTALEFYERAEKLKACDPDIYLKMGEIYADTGRRWQALEAFAKAAEMFARENRRTEALGASIQSLYLEPANLSALRSVTHLYLQENQASMALNWLRKALEKSPDNQEIQELLVRAYLAGGRLDEARQALYGLAQDASQRSHYALQLGEKFLDRGELDSAVECGRLLLESLSEKSQTDDAIGLFQNVLGIDKNHLGALKALADIFRTLGDEYSLTMILTSLFDAAVEREENTQAEMALEELVNIQTKAIDKPVEEPKLEAMVANQGFAEPRSVRSFIEIDPLEVFDPHSPFEAIGESQNGTAILAQPGSFELMGQHIGSHTTGSSLIEEPALWPADLHKTYGKVIESIEQLQRNSRFDLNEEKQLKTSKAYFHLMEAFSGFLFQAFDLDRAMPRNLQAVLDGSSALPQELFRMINLSKGESVSIQNELLSRLVNQPPKEMFSQPEQRRATRINLNLPMRVHCKEKGWREQTESLDISPLGVKFSLSHHVEPGMRLQLEMPMPENLRIYKAGKEIYEVEAYVCRILFANDGKILVGAEFGAIF
jgi:tetratricopeptide (TPR) repeat protein